MGTEYANKRQARIMAETKSFSEIVRYLTARVYGIGGVGTMPKWCLDTRHSALLALRLKLSS
jgi:hypothetical protein